MNIDAIKARAEAATPGPWFHDNAILHCGLGFEIGRLIGNVFPDIFQRDKNADFIAHAREDIPYLLSEVERLSAEITRLRSLEPYLLSLQAEEWHKDAEEERACNKKLVAKINDMAKEKQAMTARAERAEAELKAAVEDLYAACKGSPCNNGICVKKNCKGNIIPCEFEWRGTERSENDAEKR